MAPGWLIFSAAMVLAPMAAAQYPTYPQIEARLEAAAAAQPTIAQLVHIGNTYSGRDMWALCISDQAGTEEDEPEARYISTMHGDEVLGVEMTLRLIDYLLGNYGVDPRVTEIVNSIETWVVPCMNPDGYVARTRYNAQGIDLNRDFPCPYTSPANTTDGRAPETAAIMNLSFARSVTLSANLHGGALVVNYPFDANESGNSVYTSCPDDDLYIWISEEYSQHNLPMWNSASFYHGITNGADWYVIYGGMQDWNYRYMGGNEVTIELGSNKEPPFSQVPTLWNDNREAMLSYLETSLIGLRGIVTDARTGAPLAARVQVVGRDHNVYTDPDVGDYHRMLMPGVYDVLFSADGFDATTYLDVGVPPGDAARLDAALYQTIVTFPNACSISS